MKNIGFRLIVSAFLIFSGLFVQQVAAATQIDIPGPAGSEQFGIQVAALPNGNIVVRDPNYDAPGPVRNVGAVYLYNGATGALISQLTGSNTNDFVGDGVTILTNGNYVVRSSLNNSVGAVTLCNGTTGCTGVVSAANSLIGSTANDVVGLGGITILPNGNYVVSSMNWDNGGLVNAGAVTFCSGTTGCTGAVSPANSLVGSAREDRVGAVVVLTSGNYIVVSSEWDNGTIRGAGASTFCNGTTGCTGEITSANSLVGSTESDFVGATRELTNGNYVVFSSSWSNDAIANVGAVTFCNNSTTGCTGEIKPANSLIGSTANDLVGARITALDNGNYVVISSYWNHGKAADVGAVTLCSGTTGCTGVVSSANSLIGSTANDTIGINDITVLTNDNYVVSSPQWDNNLIVNAGAATFCSGTTGCTGAVSAANSLIGGQSSDFISSYGGGNGVTALTNGNYVVSSNSWSNGGIIDAGAVTWCNGITGCSGAVGAFNSLVGSTNNDRVGNSVGGTIALTNGNYVVNSYTWDNGSIVDAGAATFCNGTTGCTGAVSAANSLVGSTANDRVSYGGTTALTNGNYVVNSLFWNNGATASVGAVTFCNGTTGCIGAVSAANSLIGSTTDDFVGGFGVSSLINGNYVVNSTNWDNGTIVQAGAVTWCNGTSGCIGAVSPLNSLVGSTANDKVGIITIDPKDFITASGLRTLTNGDYVVHSSDWDNGSLVNAGAITCGDGDSGTFGPITADNSVRGTRSLVGSSFRFTLDVVNNQLVVGRPSENIVTLFRKTQTPTGIVSGSITYANASTTTPVPFTTFNATGSILLSTLTDANGFYSLIGFGSGAYTITPSKTNQVNGISNLDASLVAQHIAGLVTLNANQQIAADASGNGAISSLDAAYIAQFVTAVANPSITGTWKFLPSSRSYPNVLTNQTNQDYSAILVGEVTGNWNPLGALGSELSIIESELTRQEEKTAEDKKAGKEVAAITVEVNQSAAENSELTVELMAKETIGEDILSYQFDLFYDAAVIEPQAIGCDVAGTLSRQMTAVCHVVESGVLKVVVFGTKPISGTGTLLKLKFNVVGARGSTSPLTIKNFMFNEDIAPEVMTNGQVLIADSTTDTVSISRQLFSASGQSARQSI